MRLRRGRGSGASCAVRNADRRSRRRAARTRGRLRRGAALADAARHSPRDPGSADVIVATAGHVDHGKTSLVKALTGIDTDRLEAEKARGMSIDLGFAHTQIGGTTVAFVDVPGHERFVRNMAAGV